MDGRTLAEKLNYTGMERAVRKLAIDEKLAPVEQLNGRTDRSNAGTGSL